MLGSIALFEDRVKAGICSAVSCSAQELKTFEIIQGIRKKGEGRKGRGEEEEEAAGKGLGEKKKKQQQLTYWNLLYCEGHLCLFLAFLG